MQKREDMRMKVDEIQSCLGDLLQDWKGSVQSLLYEESDEADSLEARIKEVAAAADVPPYWLILSDLVQFADSEANIEAKIEEQSLSEQSLPKQPALERLLPEQSLPEQSLVEQSLVEQSLVEQPVPEQSVLKSTADDMAGDMAGNATGNATDDEEPVLVANAKLDPQAFGVLYERYLDRIYSYIYRRVGNTQDTEDLTAHTFFKAFDKLNSYEDRGYPFSAWLFRIAHNLVANWHRDSGRRRFMPLDRIWSYYSDSDTLDERVARDENHTALWDAIDRLPPERRELLFYKFSNCLSNVEIGELMNKSESAIKSLYFRTLAALRQDLEAAELGQ